MNSATAKEGANHGAASAKSTVQYEVFRIDTRNKELDKYRKRLDDTATFRGRSRFSKCHTRRLWHISTAFRTPLLAVAKDSVGCMIPDDVVGFGPVLAGGAINNRIF